MCRTVDQAVLLSSAFVEACGSTTQRFASVGQFRARGVARAQELFTLDPTRSAGAGAVGAALDGRDAMRHGSATGRTGRGHDDTLQDGDHRLRQDRGRPAPAVIADPDFDLAAIVSRRGVRDGVPTFRTPAELYASGTALDAVAICTPPPVRHAIAREALDAGMHVLLEKPPTPTIAELDDLAAMRRRRGGVIFTTWHSQYNAAVDEARRASPARRSPASHRLERGRAPLASRPGMDLGGRRLRRLRPRHQRAVDPDPDHARAGLRAEARTAYPVEPRYADRGLAGVCEPRSRPRTRRAAHRRIRLAPGRRSDLEHRHRHRGTATSSADRGGSRLAVNGARDRRTPMAEYEAIYRRFADLLSRRAHVDRRRSSSSPTPSWWAAGMVTAPFDT